MNIHDEMSDDEVLRRRVGVSLHNARGPAPGCGSDHDQGRCIPGAPAIRRRRPVGRRRWTPPDATTTREGGTVGWPRARPLSRPAAGLVLGLGLSGVLGSASQHPSPPVHAQLAAWTVTKQADGTVLVKIREFRDPAGLQRQTPRRWHPGQRRVQSSQSCKQERLGHRPLQGQPLPGIQRRGRPGAERRDGWEPFHRRDVRPPLGYPERRRPAIRRQQKRRVPHAGQRTMGSLRVAGPTQPAMHRQLSGLGWWWHQIPHSSATVIEMTDRPSEAVRHMQRRPVATLDEQ